MINAVSEMVSRQKRLLEVQPKVQILKKGYRKLNRSVAENNSIVRLNKDEELPSIVFTGHMRSKSVVLPESNQDIKSPTKLSKPLLVSSKSMIFNSLTDKNASESVQEQFRIELFLSKQKPNLYNSSNNDHNTTLLKKAPV